MTKVWEWSAKIMIVLLLVCLWHIFEQKKENQQLRLDNSALSVELENTRQLLVEEQAKSEALAKKTLEGLLKETNKAVVKGWEALLDNVEKELDKASSSMRSGDTESDSEEALNLDNNGDEPEGYIPGERT